MIVSVILPKSGHRQEDNEFEFNLEDNGEEEETEGIRKACVPTERTGRE